MLNWLVIGVGDITRRRVLPAIMAEPRSRLCGVVTRDPKKASSYGIAAWTDLKEGLQHSGATAVYVATPVFLHAPFTIAALEAGKHVLCEKPMAMNYAEACQMVRVARETSKLLAVAYYRRLYPKLQRAKQLLEVGVVGRPLLAEINCHDWFDNSDGQRGWLLDPSKAGGGPLYDIGSHRIDVLNFLFGVPYRVCALRSNTVHDTAVEDSATVLIEYECGVRGIVDVRWNSRVSRDQFRIIGVGGEMCLSPLNGPQLVYPGGSEDLPPHPNLHYPLIENFVDAVMNGAALAASGEAALWTDWVTEQAVKVS
jgi:predicted dehydrogenase